ncbi:MAG: hypothetical protein HON68_09025 [Gammaproteobacteria bacterium]|jgi:hypothetical protein|nr:hypothetical protein [Gammaproteobacteria bacterium]MBT4301250.1 hypothetical protein [Gammaproteobacteria bacterium]MBT4789262.1 hypothetical protein [Gammaproteobacteria bacterium]MBT5371760.1 hypothetical protein [Gammaproteobacteria bacterium]MBT7327891.1 hypothetical protein [Gammaproteobacteria bacterium]
MRSRPHAMGATALLAFLTLVFPPVGYMTGAVTGLVTLRHGAVEGLVTLLGGLAIAMVMHSLSGGHELSVALMALFWLPVWVIATLLRSSQSLRVAFQVAALFGVTALFVFYLISEGTPALWWQEVVQNLFENEQSALGDQAGEMLLDSRLAEVLSGVMAAGFFLGLVSMLMLARGWQAMLYNPGGMKTEFLALQLGRNSVLLGLVVMVPGLLMGDGVPAMVPDLIQIWMTLFMIQGIAVAHAVLDHRFKGQKGWIFALYTATLFTPLGFVVTMVGVTDAWINYRKQLIRSPE